MKSLYKFKWSFRRGGSISGVFIAQESEVEAAIGKRADFGEALGKHSEVCGTIEKDEIKRIDVSQQTVDELYAVLGSTISGYNPLSYIDEEEEDEEE